MLFVVFDMDTAVDVAMLVVCEISFDVATDTDDDISLTIIENGLKVSDTDMLVDIIAEDIVLYILLVVSDMLW